MENHDKFFKEKYLKYKKKYLNLKNKHILKGGINGSPDLKGSIFERIMGKSISAELEQISFGSITTNAMQLIYGLFAVGFGQYTQDDLDNIYNIIQYCRSIYVIDVGNLIFNPMLRVNIPGKEDIDYDQSTNNLLKDLIRRVIYEKNTLGYNNLYILCGKTFITGGISTSKLARIAEDFGLSHPDPNLVDNIIILYADAKAPTVEDTNKNGIDDLLFWVIAILCSQIINSYDERNKLGYDITSGLCNQSYNLNTATHYDNQCIRDKTQVYDDNVPELFLITEDHQKLHDCDRKTQICKNLFKEVSKLIDLQIFYLPHNSQDSMDTRADNVGLLNSYITHCMISLIQSFRSSTDGNDMPLLHQLNVYNDIDLQNHIQYSLDNYNNITLIPIHTFRLTPFKKFILLVRYLQNIYYNSFISNKYSLIDTTIFLANKI